MPAPSAPPVRSSLSGSVGHDPMLMAPVSTFNPGELARPISRLDALRQELIKAKPTAQPPSTQRRAPHTTSSIVDSQREALVGSDHLDIEDTASDDGEWQADVGPQSIPALASALWEYV